MILVARIPSAFPQMARDRRASEIELQTVRDVDHDAVHKLSIAIRELRDKLILNKHQGRLLAMRLGVALSTLLRMPDARPTAQMVSVVHASHHLLHMLSRDDTAWHFALLHFTGKNVFAGMRERLAKVWSLHPTASWAAEDNAAAATDEAALMSAIQQRVAANDTGIPARIAELARSDGLDIYLRRRSSASGWKISLADLSTSAARPPECMPHACRGIDFSSAAAAPREFVTYRGADAESASWFDDTVVRFRELAPTAVDVEDLECFVVDVVQRYSWCHPNVVPLYGAYTEALAPDGTPHIALGVIEADPESQGFLSLHDLLFTRGQRVGLHVAITTCLKIADAMQYCVFDAAHVALRQMLTWCMAPPSSVFVRHHGHSDAMFVAPSVEHLLGRDDVDVQFAPALPMHGVVSRWQPPDLAQCREAYAIGMLLVAMLTNAPAHARCADQSAVRQAVAYAEQPFEVPRAVPHQVQQLIRACFALQGQDAPHFATARHFRQALLQLRDLGVEFTAPAPGSAVEPVASGDYGPTQNQVQAPACDAAA